MKVISGFFCPQNHSNLENFYLTYGLVGEIFGDIQMIARTQIVIQILLLYCYIVIQITRLNLIMTPIAGYARNRNYEHICILI